MREYFEIVPRGGNIPRAEGASPEPTPLEILAAATSEGAWDVPIELVLACSSSRFKRVIYARHGRGDGPQRMARAFLRGGQFFALIYFAKFTDLLLPLDCWALENRPEAQP